MHGAASNPRAFPNLPAAHGVYRTPPGSSRTSCRFPENRAPGERPGQAIARGSLREYDARVKGGITLIRPPASATRQAVLIISVNAGKIEAGANGKSREARVVFHAAQAFLHHGEERLAVARQARRRIVRPRIIDANRHHGFESCPFNTSAKSRT